MKNILILNGASRKNGNTAELIKSFINGAESAGNEVTEFYLQKMNIHGCLGCENCLKGECSQKDDMTEIYNAFDSTDVVVFASPIYFWTITGPLKTTTDRLFAKLKSLGYGDFARESILIMTAGSTDYSQAQRWYETFERNLGWKNLGEILGAGKTKQAEELGRSI